MNTDTEIEVTFKASELIEIIADYFGYEKEDVDLNEYSEDYIKEIILERIM